MQLTWNPKEMKRRKVEAILKQCLRIFPGRIHSIYRKHLSQYCIVLHCTFVWSTNESISEQLYSYLKKKLFLKKGFELVLPSLNRPSSIIHYSNKASIQGFQETQTFIFGAVFFVSKFLFGNWGPKASMQRNIFSTSPHFAVNLQPKYFLGKSNGR